MQSYEHFPEPPTFTSKIKRSTVHSVAPLSTLLSFRHTFAPYLSHLRASQEDFSLSQAACEPAKRVFHSRKPLASQPRGFFTLASRLRASQDSFSPSQAACEPVKRIFHSRKPLASQPRGFFALASRLRASPAEAVRHYDGSTCS